MSGNQCHHGFGRGYSCLKLPKTAQCRNMRESANVGVLGCGQGAFSQRPKAPKGTQNCTMPDYSGLCPWLAFLGAFRRSQPAAASA
eukprot:3868970-Alexandrium_andersonii.AAC.1